MKTLHSKIANNTLKTTLFWMGLALVLIMVMGGFDPYYSGNQTTKFLFGFADAGIGYLPQDWMANTRDPLPVFSWIIQFTYQYLGEWAITVYIIILVGIYIYSLMMILDHFFKISESRLLFFMVAVVVILTYSNLWPFSVRSLLTSGVAIQGMALTQFLPNGFAVLFFLAILLFLKNKPYWAVVVVALASSVHTGYMIIGAALVSAYLVIDFWEFRDFKRILMIGGLALILVLPMVIMYVTANLNASAAQVAEANDIVVNIRIPHHTLVSEWWGRSALIKLLLVLAAILVMRRTKMLPILLIGLLVVYGPALALSIHPSNRIAILQLWRMSVVLIPLSSALLIGKFVTVVYHRFKDQIEIRRWVVVLILSVALLAVLIYGVVNSIERWSDLEERPGVGLMAYVAQNGGPNEVYLVPPEDGFLYAFRLRTGQPIYINWKSHPWNSVELLEWYRRMGVAKEFYDTVSSGQCLLFTESGELTEITHVVLPAVDKLDCEGATILYSNEDYTLYRIRP